MRKKYGPAHASHHQIDTPIPEVDTEANLEKIANLLIVKPKPLIIPPNDFGVKKRYSGDSLASQFLSVKNPLNNIFNGNTDKETPLFRFDTPAFVAESQ